MNRVAYLQVIAQISRVQQVFVVLRSLVAKTKSIQRCCCHCLYEVLSLGNPLLASDFNLIRVHVATRVSQLSPNGQLIEENLEIVRPGDAAGMM